MDLPERDGDGYLVDMNAWTAEIGKAMAAADGVELSDEQWQQILKAREYYEEFSVVPPIRKFARHIGADQKTNVQNVDDRSHETHYQVRWPAQAHRLRLNPVIFKGEQQLTFFVSVHRGRLYQA